MGSRRGVFFDKGCFLAQPRFYISTRYPNALPGGTPYQAYTAGDLAQAGDDVGRVCTVARKFLAASVHSDD